MRRQRQWRRAQAERKLARIMRHSGIKWYYRRWGDMYWHYMTYERRISITEVVEVQVHSYEDFLVRQRWFARKLRDTPKQCRCSCCCNPRASCLYNGRERLTLQERKFLLSCAEQMMAEQMAEHDG